jgi:hypothetical protein
MSRLSRCVTATLPGRAVVSLSVSAPNDGGRSAAQMSVLLPPEKELPVRIAKEAEWGPQPAWTFRRREGSVSSGGKCVGSYETPFNSQIQSFYLP